MLSLSARAAGPMVMTYSKLFVVAAQGILKGVFKMTETFWEETVAKLKENGKTFDDVEWIGRDDFEITKENFKNISHFCYDSGYGGQEVANDLKLVGKDFIMIRGEYDGSEWWEFIRTKPTGVIKEVNNLAESEAQLYWSRKGYNDIYFCNNSLKTLNGIDKNWDDRWAF